MADAPTSKGEQQLQEILRETFPGHKILWHHPVKVAGKTLYLDAYLPRLKMAFEVDGIQHYTQNSFFHRNERDFQRGKLNDSLKSAWCAAQNITLIRLDYSRKALTKKTIYASIQEAAEQRHATQQ